MGQNTDTERREETTERARSVSRQTVLKSIVFGGTYISPPNDVR